MKIVSNVVKTVVVLAVVVSALVVLTSFASRADAPAIKAAPEKTSVPKAKGRTASEFPHSLVCTYLDDKVGFARCETVEVVCYVSKGGQTCFAKPAPRPAPSASPAPVSTPTAAKK